MRGRASLPAVFRNAARKARRPPRPQDVIPAAGEAGEPGSIGTLSRRETEGVRFTPRLSYPRRRVSSIRWVSWFCESGSLRPSAARLGRSRATWGYWVPVSGSAGTGTTAERGTARGMARRRFVASSPPLWQPIDPGSAASPAAGVTSVGGMTGACLRATGGDGREDARSCLPPGRLSQRGEESTSSAPPAGCRPGSAWARNPLRRGDDGCGVQGAASAGEAGVSRCRAVQPEESFAGLQT